MPNRALGWVAAIALGFALSCGGDDDGGGGGSGSGGGGNAMGMECEPATSFSCVGSNGCQGTQLCNANGTWGYCSCGPRGGGGNSSGGSGSGGNGSGEADAGGAGTNGSGDAGMAEAGTGGSGEAGMGEAGSGGAGSGEAGTGGSSSQDEEDCDNGDDDDGDGDVDCADDDCAERICARVAPDGWTGPAVLFVNDLPNDCPSAYDDELVRGGLDAVGADADCDTCTCTPSSPDCASFLNFAVGSDDQCGGVECTASVSGSCSNLTSSCLNGLTTGYVETHLPAGLASCAPSAQTPELPALEWTEPILGCGNDRLEQGGCPSGRVCAAPLPDGTLLCIMRDGDHACPSGAYTDRTVYYTGTTDDRSCTDCACDHDCSYSWQIYDTADTTCSDALLSLDSENQCAQVTPTAGAIRVGVTIDGTGDCAPSGGEPQGSVGATDPITVCCIP